MKENAGALIVFSKEIGLEVNADKLSTWSCLEIRMQDKITVRKVIIFPLKMWKISSIWEKL